MRIVEPSVELLAYTPDMLKLIERAGRTCYQSAKKITNKSAEAFVRMVRERGHHSVLEHGSATFKFICSRGETHELVRHRLASYSQESTRYVRVCDSSLGVRSDEDVLRFYQDNFTMKEISELSFGRLSEWQVGKILRDAGITIRGHNRRGNVFEDFFSKIDSGEKAWFLGLLAADGSIRSTGIGFTVTQKIENSWYVGRFIREYLYPRVKPSVDKGCHQYAVNSAQMVQDLLNCGLEPRKSFEWSPEGVHRLWEVTEAYRWDFLRGLFDGDGCLRFYEQSNPGKTKSCVLQVVGCESLMSLVRDEIIRNGFRCSLHRDSVTEQLWRATVHGYANGRAVCDKLYETFQFPYGHPFKAGRYFDEVGRLPSIPKIGQGEAQFILPPIHKAGALWPWCQAVLSSEEAYTKMIMHGCKPQIARSVLPICLKTEIVTTANVREWRHILTLRTSGKAHPQIRKLMMDVWNIFHEKWSVLVEDIEPYVDK